MRILYGDQSTRETSQRSWPSATSTVPWWGSLAGPRSVCRHRPLLDVSMSLRRPRLGTAVTGLLVVVAACSPGTGVRPDPGSATTSTLPPTTSTTTTTPPSRYGGTVVVGVGDAGSPRTLNPFLDGPDAAVLDLIGPAIFARGWIAHPVTDCRLPTSLRAFRRWATVSSSTTATARWRSLQSCRVARLGRWDADLG